jgi:hypothetical protein
MIPGIWCKSHDLEGRTIHDMHDVDPEQNEVSVDERMELTADCTAGLRLVVQGHAAGRVIRTAPQSNTTGQVCPTA